MSEEVVAMIAGITARRIPGIHALGRARLISFGDRPSHGVVAEVGREEAAFDLEVVMEHGCDLHEVAAELRRQVAADVYRMTGRTVVELNIDVVGLFIPPETE
jgi:uncharacterized alkaline shock family protein YloU